MSIISFLIIAWFLSLFQFDDIVTDAIHELFRKKVTTATYYFIFFCIGIIGEFYLIFTGYYVN